MKINMKVVKNMKLMKEFSIDVKNVPFMFSVAS